MVHEEGPAGPFHQRDLSGAPGGTTAWFLTVTEPALVLGSTQDPAAVVDAGAASRSGVAVVRRRSGGGAVLLEPGRVMWVDLFVPAGDPLSEVDVGRAFHWVGRLWTGALAAVGVAGQWHDGPLLHTPWSNLACFAALGPGEVTVDGRKVVGISQRRTRSGALFQCAALLDWDPQRLVALLALTPDQRGLATVDLGAIASGVPVEQPVLTVALMEALAAA